MHAVIAPALATTPASLAGFSLLSGQGGGEIFFIGGFIALGVGAFSFLLVGQRWGRRFVAGVRNYKVEKWHRIKPIGDTIQLSLAALIMTIGVLALLLANALRAVDIYQDRILIGWIEYMGKTADDKLIFEHQPTDPTGVPNGPPTRCMSHGDSIEVDYTFVRIKDDFFILGFEQLYKIDYVGGTYDDPRKYETHARPHYEAIGDGRLIKYRDMKERLEDGRDLPFPHNLFVDGVDFKREHVNVVRLSGEAIEVGTRWYLYLAHNTLFIQPTMDPPDDDEIKAREERDVDE